MNPDTTGKSPSTLKWFIRIDGLKHSSALFIYCPKPPLCKVKLFTSSFKVSTRWQALMVEPQQTYVEIYSKSSSSIIDDSKIYKLCRKIMKESVHEACLICWKKISLEKQVKPPPKLHMPQNPTIVHVFPRIIDDRIFHQSYSINCWGRGWQSFESKRKKSLSKWKICKSQCTLSRIRFI